MIVGVEKNVYQEQCYHQQYNLSLHSLHTRFPSKTVHTIFGGRILVNWGIFAEPGNVVLGNTLRNAVNLIKLEYFRKSALIWNAKQPHWMHIMCVTGPRLLTASALESILAYPGHEHDLIEVKGGTDFRVYKGAFKLNDDSVSKEAHYMHFMVRDGVSLLGSYYESYDRSILSSNGDTYYFVYLNQLYEFINWEACEQLKFSKDQVIKVNESILNTFPKADRKLSMADQVWITTIMQRPAFLDEEVKEQ
jgi:hypothetical protein